MANMEVIQGTFSCNRQPFLSGDGCDRGNVDIHQFDDLPYCDPIDPTPADIPPEVIDTLQIPLVPPPCACIDIKYVLRKFKYSKNLKFNAEFKSIGDCCEGNYQADFDIELPCPIEKIDKKWYRQRLKWNKESEFEKIYIQDAEDCGLEPFDIDFELGLKCPVRTNGEKKISIGLDWGEKQDKQEKKYVDTQNDDEDCSITPKDVDFDLELPCPIPDTVEDNIKIELKWQDKQTDTKPIILKKVEDCSLDIDAPDFDLGLPCPIPTRKAKNITISLDWKNKKKDTKELVIKRNQECELDLLTKDFDLGLPCPIPSGDIKLRPSLKWGQTFKSPEVVLAHGDQKNCETEFYDKPLDLEIPCPFDNLNFHGSIHEGAENAITITKDSKKDCGLDVFIDITLAGGDDECECIKIKHAWDDRYEGCLCNNNVVKPHTETNSSNSVGSVRRSYYFPREFTVVRMKLIERGGCCCTEDCGEDDVTSMYVIKTPSGWKWWDYTAATPDKIYVDELHNLEYECDPGCSSSSPSSSSLSSNPSSGQSSPSSSNPPSSPQSSPTTSSHQSPDSTSPGGGSGSPGGDNSPEGDNSPSGICVNSFVNISGSGPKITVEYEIICFDGTNKGKQTVEYTLPTAKHVNKCCDCAETNAE